MNTYRFQVKENHGEHGGHGGHGGRIWLAGSERPDFLACHRLSFPVSPVFPVVNWKFLFLECDSNIAVHFDPLPL